MNLKSIGEQAKQSSNGLAVLTSQQKNKALDRVYHALLKNTDKILIANQKDMENGRRKGLNEGLLDRLMLNQERIQAMADSIRDIIQLEDPIGEVLDSYTLENGLQIKKKRVPIGVIGIIYEARPNVTLDAFTICFKTGNAVFLKGGSDALYSNQAITKAIQEGLMDSQIDENAIQLITSTSH